MSRRSRMTPGKIDLRIGEPVEMRTPNPDGSQITGSVRAVGVDVERDPNEPPFLSQTKLQLFGTAVCNQKVGSGMFTISDNRTYGRDFIVEVTDRDMHESCIAHLNPIALEHLRQWLNRRFEEKPL